MKNNGLLKKYAGISLIIEYMEESINWPNPDDQETFEKQLLG